MTEEFRVTRQMVQHIIEVVSDDLQELHESLREIYKHYATCAVYLAVGIMLVHLLKLDDNDGESFTADVINQTLEKFGLLWRLVPLA
jgi:hypothetical protein